MEKPMRNMSLRTLAGTLIAGGAVLWAIPAAPAASLGGGLVRGVPAPTEPAVERVQYGRGYCAELRRACLYKGALGERGQGNCSRYRSECRGSGYNGYSGYSGYRAYPSYRPYQRGYWD
jgi:hypothetical protein